MSKKYLHVVDKINIVYGCLLGQSLRLISTCWDHGENFHGFPQELQKTLLKAVIHGHLTN